MTLVNWIRLPSERRLSYLSRCLGILLTLAPLAACTAEPLEYYGFDEATQSANSREGMEEIFAGRCFHAGVPVASARMVLAALARSKDSLGYNPCRPKAASTPADVSPRLPTARPGPLPASAWAKACSSAT